MIGFNMGGANWGARKPRPIPENLIMDTDGRIYNWDKLTELERECILLRKEVESYQADQMLCHEEMDRRGITRTNQYGAPLSLFSRLLRYYKQCENAAKGEEK
jgi:hypothetical protein